MSPKSPVTSLKILAMADLHDRYEMLPSRGEIDADLIVFAGDLHNGSDRIKAKPAAEALGALGPPVIIVPGNTDHRDMAPKLWEEAGLKNIDRGFHICRDCGFIGLGGMVPRDPKRLGDPGRYYLPDSNFRDVLTRSSSNIMGVEHRIVVTHQPPFGACDRLYTGANAGSPALRRFIEEDKPDLLICGHIHEDRGEASIGKTRIVNVGEMRRGYAAIIDIDEDIHITPIEP